METDKLNEHTEYKVAMGLWKYCPPILLVLGSVGNLLTIIVLMQRRNRSSSTAMYLTALAVSDFLVLWTGLSRQWVMNAYGKDIRVFTDIGCWLHVFLTYMSFQCSSWFLVAVTMERLIAVMFPHKIKVFCSRRNAGAFIMIIITLLVLLNTHWFYGFTVQSYPIRNNTFKKDCIEINDTTYVAFLDKWNWIDLCVVSLVPSILLSFANIAIITRLFIRRRKSNNQIVPHNGRLVARNEKVPQLTLMLIIVSFVFIICSTPMSVFIISCHVSHSQGKKSQDHAVQMLWQAILFLLAYLNSTLNFVLYFMSGYKFRQEVKYFLCRNECALGVTRDSKRTSQRLGQTNRLNTIVGMQS